MAWKRRFNGISRKPSGKYTGAQKHLPVNTIFQGCNYRDFVSFISERKSPFIWIFQSRISICVYVSLSSLSAKLYNCIPASFVYRQADKRFWDSPSQGKGRDVKARFDKLPTARPSGKLSEKASLTLEQFVAELKKRIQEKTEKQKNDKLLAKAPNERPKTIPKPIQRQQKILQRPKGIIVKVEDNAGSGAGSKPSNSANIPLPPGTQKKETQSENGVRNPDKGKDAKIVTGKPRTGSGEIKPSELPQINNKVPRLPNIKQFPRIPAR